MTATWAWDVVVVVVLAFTAVALLELLWWGPRRTAQARLDVSDLVEDALEGLECIENELAVLGDIRSVLGDILGELQCQGGAQAQRTVIGTSLHAMAERVCTDDVQA